VGRAGLATVAVYAALGGLVILFLGLRLGLPVALLVVGGRSMEPTYRPGDLLVAVRAGPGDVEPGDVVVWCRPGGGCTVHRLVSVNGSYIVTWGDNRGTNPAPDPPVPASWLRYRVVARVPREAAAGAVAAGLVFYALRRRRRF